MPFDFRNHKRTATYESIEIWHERYDPATPWINPIYRLERRLDQVDDRWQDKDMISIGGPNGWAWTELEAALEQFDPPPWAREQVMQ